VEQLEILGPMVIKLETRTHDVAYYRTKHKNLAGKSVKNMWSEKIGASYGLKGKVKGETAWGEGQTQDAKILKNQPLKKSLKIPKGPKAISYGIKNDPSEKVICQGFSGLWGQRAFQEKP
jgi:hypothetical protein